jgi:hypothetical protein
MKPSLLSITKQMSITLGAGAVSVGLLSRSTLTAVRLLRHVKYTYIRLGLWCVFCPVAPRTGWQRIIVIIQSNSIAAVVAGVCTCPRLFSGSRHKIDPRSFPIEAATIAEGMSARSRIHLTPKAHYTK